MKAKIYCKKKLFKKVDKWMVKNFGNKALKQTNKFGIGTNDRDFWTGYYISLKFNCESFTVSKKYYKINLPSKD